MIRKFFAFIGNVIKTAVKTVFTIVKNIVCNAEAVTILSLSAVGTTAVLTELPFHFAAPIFLETPVVIPAVSVLIVLTLVTILEIRMHLSKQY